MQHHPHDYTKKKNMQKLYAVTNQTDAKAELLTSSCSEDELKCSRWVKGEERGVKTEVLRLLSSPPESPIKQYKSQAYWVDFMAARWHERGQDCL